MRGSDFDLENKFGDMWLERINSLQIQNSGNELSCLDFSTILLKWTASLGCISRCGIWNYLVRDSTH